jgi:hypothetical protein
LPATKTGSTPLSLIGSPSADAALTPAAKASIIVSNTAELNLANFRFIVLSPLDEMNFIFDPWMTI